MSSVTDTEECPSICDRQFKNIFIAQIRENMQTNVYTVAVRRRRLQSLSYVNIIEFF